MEWRDFEYAVVLGAINLAENQPEEKNHNAKHSKGANENPEQIFDQDHKNHDSGLPNTTNSANAYSAFQKNSQDDQSSNAEQNPTNSNANLALPPTYEIHFGDGLKLELVLIPAGTFMMGSPKTEQDRGSNEILHQVTISNPFYMGKYQVTQKEWQTVMGNNPSHFKGARLPVEQVSWDDAMAFCAKVKQQTGQAIRLPTEAEWEYACRAGTTTPFHFGKELNGTQANCDGNSPYGTTTKGPYLGKTSAVGSYPSNAWGLHDMHGNVWEWCSDWYGEYPDIRTTDPQGPQKGDVRVLRGGSWYGFPVRCRASYRSRGNPGNRLSYYGFRVILPLDRLTLQPKQDSTSHTGDIAPDLGPEWQSWIVSNSTKEQLEE
ncbi:MAG: formylglycine-generating enzyme family protein, partial [Sphingomonadales bacterium]|nr:formylglycine-generating enzyme family protein [Sphingomonadales bacterium]